MLVGIEPEVWKEGDGMVRARLRCSIWILAVLRRLLDILSMRGVQPGVGPPYVYIIIIAVSLSIVLYHIAHSGYIRRYVLERKLLGCNSSMA